MSDYTGSGGTRQDREWQQFLDGAVHDLRAGLRAVRISAELVASGAEGARDTRRTIITLLDGVDKIDTLSLALGRYSRTLFTEGREVGVVSLAAAVKSAVAELRSPIEKTKAEVRFGELPKVRGCNTGLIALFRELLMNSLTYCSAAPPRIEITASSEMDQWRLAVADNGIGIEQDYWQKVFVPFQRLQRDPYGAGLGLAICKNVVQRHGGRIWLISEPGLGSTVLFQLPKTD
jgi:signal transduction histidine kinase